MLKISLTLAISTYFPKKKDQGEIEPLEPLTSL